MLYPEEKVLREVVDIEEPEAAPEEDKVEEEESVASKIAMEEVMALEKEADEEEDK